MSSTNTIVIFGAGNIGRGLMAELVSGAGMLPVLVEAVEDFARKLSEAESFQVLLEGQQKSVRQISNYAVIPAVCDSEVVDALVNCSFAATAVGGPNLGSIAPLLAQGIIARGRPLNILVCENWPHADEVLGEAIESAGASREMFASVHCSVERMVQSSKASLDLTGEYGQGIYADAGSWIGDVPEIAGLSFRGDIDALYTRKIFTNNAGHALLGYLGFQAGCRYVYEAAEMDEVRIYLEELLRVAGKAVVMARGMDQSEMDKHIETLLNYRYVNRGLGDTVQRVARSPIRKLGPGERLVGLVRLLQQCDLPTLPVSRVIGAAMRYNDPSDGECVSLAGIIRDKGPDEVLRSICGLASGDICYRECLDFYNSYK
ncbi:MAG: hypothetical protein ABFD54_03355 [Armatimonadota bacterium]|nr:hypothetical protein [bacterium]